jgi:MFS family permease
MLVDDRGGGGAGGGASWADMGDPEPVKTVVITRYADADEIALLSQARTAPMLEAVEHSEEPAGEGPAVAAERRLVFGLVDGPFDHYQRVLEIDPVDDDGAPITEPSLEIRTTRGAKTFRKIKTGTTTITSRQVGDAEPVEKVRNRVRHSKAERRFFAEDAATALVEPRLIREATSFRLAIPIWGALFMPLVVKATITPPLEGAQLWWLPPDRMDKRATGVLSRLCVFSLMAAYLGVLVSQLNPYFKVQFDATNDDIANVLLFVRIAGVFALAVVAMADRRGRKTMLMGSLYIAIAFAAIGAFAPNLVLLGVSQTACRTFSAAVVIIVGIMSAEEMPRGARAFGVSVLVATGALGAGGVIVFLFVADLAEWTWRIFFLVPLLAIYPAWRVGRKLPESRRFEVYELTSAGEEPPGATPAASAPAADTRKVSALAAVALAPSDGLPGGVAPGGEGAEVVVTSKGLRQRIGFRFLVLATSAFLVNIFSSPAGGFLNEFLKTEQGYNGAKIAALQVITNVPGGLSMIVGGRLAESRGRRVIGAIGIAGGFGFTILMYLSTGAPIWLFSTFATLLGAMAIPALGVYGAELFPTKTRGLAGGGINLFGVAGGAIGLKLVGRLADEWGGFGPAIAVLVFAPILVVILILAFYPETAHKELEELNPEDAAPPHDDRAALAELDEEWAEVHEQHAHTHLHLGHGHGHADGPADAGPDTEASTEPSTEPSTEASTEPSPAPVPGGPAAGDDGPAGPAGTISPRA